MADLSNHSLTAADVPDVDPNAFSTGTDSTTSGKDPLKGAKNAASSAYNAVAEHPVTQNVAETVKNAPVTQAAKKEAAKTQDEFDGLMSSRHTPATTAATGQNLTHYHSFFYDLLSWEHPRMSAIAYATTVITIVAARYAPILPMAFKFSAYTLGVVSLTEGIAKLVLSQSLIASIRPNRYYTIPRETMEAALEDVEQLINFFVIEFQRVLFAENVFITFATFIASVLGYFLIKVTPFWGLCLMGVTTLFIGPLIYRTNQEIIDQQIGQVSDLVNAQANQVRDIAGQHTSRATDAIKTYTSEYSAKAQEYLGNSKRQDTPVKRADFPNAPKTNPADSTAASTEPIAA